MPYDEKLARRIRAAIGPNPDIEERKMFGGIAFLLRGRMFCGIANENLMVRVGPEAYDEALTHAHVRPMDFTGRPMRGYIYVTPAGCKSAAAVRPWVNKGASFVAELKQQAPSRRRRSGGRRR